mmetsp:Transcript_56259/g.131794  ORF Transcript_56259/g.131794 Transcript_56259/m.131794 type:complete len:205 (-) Transcript_56259:292-906(-)
MRLTSFPTAIAAAILRGLPIELQPQLLRVQRGLCEVAASLLSLSSCSIELFSQQGDGGLLCCSICSKLRNVADKSAPTLLSTLPQLLLCAHLHGSTAHSCRAHSCPTSYSMGASLFNYLKVSNTLLLVGQILLRLRYLGFQPSNLMCSLRLFDVQAFNLHLVVINVLLEMLDLCLHLHLRLLLAGFRHASLIQADSLHATNIQV